VIIALYKSTFTISYHTIRGATCPDEWEWTLTMHNRWCFSDAAVCQTERFSARCDGDDEVILVTSAQYGRMKVSRCVQVMHRLIGRYRRAFKHRNSFRHKPPHKHQTCGGNMRKYGTELLDYPFPFHTPERSRHMDGAILLATRWPR